MKKILVGLVLSVFGAVLSVSASQTVNAVAEGTTTAVDTGCRVETVGTQEGANGTHSKFTIASNKATVKFKVIGGDNCSREVALKSYQSTSGNRDPRPKQVLFQQVTKTVKPGSHSMTVDLPPTGCFFQVDFVRILNAEQRAANDGKNKMLGFVLGGEKNCIPTEQPKQMDVCDLRSHTVIRINQSDFNATVHSRDLTLCNPVVTPPTLTVCDLSTKKTTTIKESEFDSTKFSKTTADCNVVEAVAVTQTPTEVAKTGPEAIVAGLFGTGSLAGSAAYYLRSRRELFRVR